MSIKWVVAIEDAVERLYLGQQLVGLSDFPELTGAAPVVQERIGFILHQHHLPLAGVAEHLGDALFRFSHVLVQQIGSEFDQQGLLLRIGNMTGQF